ncbi:unnamed protein product, partial [Polarella glacialis]
MTPTSLSRTSMGRFKPLLPIAAGAALRGQVPRALALKVPLLSRRGPLKPQHSQLCQSRLPHFQSTSSSSSSRCLSSGQAPEARRNGGQQRCTKEQLSRVFTALKLTTFSLEELKAAFKSIDRDGSGSVDFDELLAMLLDMEGCLDRQGAERIAALLMRHFSKDQIGRISFEEFRRGVLKLADQERVRSVLAAVDSKGFGTQNVGSEFARSLNLTSLSEIQLRASFSQVDLDGSGEIDLSELTQLMRSGLRLPQREAEEMAALLMHRIDSNHDGHISFDEFQRGLKALVRQRDPRVWPIAGMMFVSGVTAGAMAPAMPLMVQELSLSQAEFGYVNSAFGLSKLLANVPTATLIERCGHKPAIVWGLVAESTSMLAMGMTSSMPQLAGARFLNGIGVASCVAGAMVAVTDMSTPLNRAKMMATISMAFSGGKVLGPAIGGALVS